MSLPIQPNTYGGDIDLSTEDFIVPADQSPQLLLVGDGGTVVFENPQGVQQTITLGVGQYIINFRKIVKDGTSASQLAYLGRVTTSG